MIAYYFPPLGGAGVQRTAKFAKYLARLGWRLEVVSVEPPSFELRDDSGLAEVSHESIQIHRVKYREPFRNLDRLPGGWRLRSRCQDWMLFPDRMAGWLSPALMAANRICEANPGIAVYTTSAPYTAHLIGRRLKQHFKLPWIADFRDEWSLNPYFSFPAKCQIFRHRQAERSVLNGADLVLTVTDKISTGLRGLAPKSGALFGVIPNGFDPDDFRGLTREKDPHFTITHVGTLIPERSKLLQPLFQELDGLIKIGQLPWNAIKLKLVGQGNYRDLNFPGHIVVETLAYVSHHEALQVMSGSDLLILAESNPAAFTGKIFEYMALKRPILGLVHPSSPAANLIREAGAGWVIASGNDPDTYGPEDIGSILLQCYDAKQSGQACCQWKPEAIARYNREKQAKQLEEMILSVFKKYEGEV
jgi:glycosyltransferase involved in cell wall biosynthesis